MKHRHRALLVALSIALGTSSSSYALAQAQEIAIDPKAFFDRAASEGKFQDFDQVVKDMVKMEGLMTLYRYKPDDATKDQTRLLAQIPKKLLGQDLLLATSISRGEMSGFQWNDYLVRMKMQGRKVMIEVPDLRGGFSHLIAALAAEGTSTVHGVELIDRGYEHFFAKLEGLGAVVARAEPAAV